MSKKIIIELSLIRESQNKPESLIIEEIISAFSKDNLIIPWCSRIERISVKDTESEICEFKISANTELIIDKYDGD